jgi:hypothetical protein
MTKKLPQIVLHLSPPPMFAKSWIEVDGKVLPCQSVTIETSVKDPIGSLVLKIAMSRVNMVIEPPFETKIEDDTEGINFSIPGG